MQNANAPARMTEPSADITTRHQQAVKLMQEEKWQAAVDMLEAITAEQPGLSGPWVNLGIAYTKRGNSQEAEAAFKHAIDVNAANAEAYTSSVSCTAAPGGPRKHASSMRAGYSWSLTIAAFTGTWRFSLIPTCRIHARPCCIISVTS